MPDFKKIKKAAIGVFWRESESPAENRPEDLGPNPVSASPASLPPLDPLAVPVVNDNTFYPAIEKELLAAMPPEFAEFYNQMAVINDKFSHLDQATRDKLAFHAAQTALKVRQLNLSPAVIQQAMQLLSKKLESEKQEFLLQNNKGFQQRQAGIHNKIQELKQGIKARESRLQSIQQELDAYVKAKNEEMKKLESEKARLLSDQLVTENEFNQIEQKKQEREQQFSGALKSHEARLAELKNRLQSNLSDLK